MRYWLSINDGKTYGPYDRAQLADLVAKGRMDESAMLCAEGSTEWQPAPSVLPDLFASAEPPEPDMPPAPARRDPRPSAASSSGGSARTPAPRAARAAADDTGDEDKQFEQPRRARRSRVRIEDEEERDPDDPASPLYFLARIVASLIDTLARVARGGIFRTASVSAWNLGHIAFLIGAGSVVLFIVVFAIRLDSLSTMGFAATVPIAAALGQYIALRFAPTNETLVKNSPLRASGETFFQLLGFVMILVAVGLAGLGIYAAVRDGEMVTIVGPAIAAGILATIGFLFFSPASLSLTVDPSATAGEDGLALVGTLIKALLASTRFIFGLLAIAGGLTAAVGAVWFLLDAQDFRPLLIANAGGLQLIVAATYPIYAYVLAILYFVLVDAIKGLISLNRGKEAREEPKAG
jgi:hypothetical protein